MKLFLAAGKNGERNVLLFTIGINTAYRISDLRTLKLRDRGIQFIVCIIQIAANIFIR